MVVLNTQDHTDGYRWLKLPPGNGRVLMHMQLFQDVVVRRQLRAQEEVHHQDHNKINNCLGNLQLITGLEHRRRHGAQRRAPARLGRRVRAPRRQVRRE